MSARDKLWASAKGSLCAAAAPSETSARMLLILFLRSFFNDTIDAMATGRGRSRNSGDVSSKVPLVHVQKTCQSSKTAQDPSCK